jgi:hypothetical protein
VQVIAIQAQLGQFLLQPLRIKPKIDQRPDKHIPADTAK